MGTDVQPPTTLANLLEHVAQAPSLSEPRRRAMKYALHAFCRVVKSEPHLVPASASRLQPLIVSGMPASVGMSADGWRNTKSLLRQALALTDPAALPARSRANLLPGWATLLENPASEPMIRGIARFSKWCSANDILPIDVSQEVYERFHDDLAEHCLLRNPAETQQTAGKAWNAAVQAVPGWPKIELYIKDRRRNPSLPWSAFPPSLEAEVEAYLADRAVEELDFSKDQILFRPTTVTTRRAQIRQFVTAVVQSGVPAAELASLADLVTLENAHAGLQTLAKRTGKRASGRNHNIACLLLALARHAVQSDEQVIKGLKLCCKRAKPSDSGELTIKNRQLLLQFDDERNVAKYLMLPGRLMRAACSVPTPTAAEARLAQVAVTLEILTFAPLRIKNVAELEIGRTLVLSDKTGHIIIPRAEVKNKADIILPLPATAVAMIKRYVKQFHPLLAPPGSLMLFPSHRCAHKHSSVMGTTIRKIFRDECGLEFHVHAVRHLAAKLFLEDNPGQYGIVKLLLGHKSIETTERVYCGTEGPAAFRVLSKMVETKRGTLKEWIS